MSSVSNIEAMPDVLEWTGHRDVLPCYKKDLDVYCDFIARKERVFRELVGEPADQFIDLFWARPARSSSRSGLSRGRGGRHHRC